MKRYLQNSWFLTFSHTLANAIEVGHIKVIVRHYTPNHRRCFKCQRYGHGPQSWRGCKTCARSASNDRAVWCARVQHPTPEGRPNGRVMRALGYRVKAALPPLKRACWPLSRKPIGLSPFGRGPQSVHVRVLRGPSAPPKRG